MSLHFKLFDHDGVWGLSIECKSGQWVPYATSELKSTKANADKAAYSCYSSILRANLNRILQNMEKHTLVEIDGFKDFQLGPFSDPDWRSIVRQINEN